MKKSSPRIFTKNIFVLAALTLSSVAVCAQQPINTPQQLKAACENSPGNIVTINQSSTISLPVFPSASTQVNCGCTIILANESTIAFELSNLQFAGPVSFQSTGKGEVKVIKSSLKATSIAFTLGGTNSALSASESLIQAFTGNVTAAFGVQAKMELYGRLTPSTADAIKAPGVVNINAGSQFTGSVADMGISGTQGIQLSATGFETKLKIENVSFQSSQGSAAITANGAKGSLEMMETGFQVSSASSIHFGGEEATLKIIETRFWGPDYNTPTTGGVTIVAGSANANNTKIEMSEVIARNITGNFSVASSANAEKGNVKMEKSAMIITGAVIFETGRLGSTEVKENSITSSASITIKTGVGGNCIAAPNRTLSAPVVEACLPTAAKNSVATQTGLTGQNIAVFPNPGTNGTVNVNFENANDIKDIIVVNTAGATVKQWSGYRNNSLLISQLKPGFYSLKVLNRATGKTNSKKFIVGN